MNNDNTNGSPHASVTAQDGETKASLNIPAEKQSVEDQKHQSKAKTVKSKKTSNVAEIWYGPPELH